MDLKYLPLGTVCSVNGKEKKMMIVGYQNSDFEYTVLPFPEGMRTEDDIQFANHVDIVEIHSTGFNNKDYGEYNSILLSAAGTPEYKFDENGTVISDENDYEIVPEMHLQFDESGVVINDGSEQTEMIFEQTLQFNENGVVVADASLAGETIVTDIQFDENGVVVSDGAVVGEVPVAALQFDENGVVISDGSDYYEDLSEMRLEFDENGVVISDGRETLDLAAEEATEEKFEELREEIAIDLRYDEDGRIILDEFEFTEKESAEEVNETISAEIDEVEQEEVIVVDDDSKEGLSNEADEKETREEESKDDSEDDDGEPKKKKGFFGGLFG